MKPEPSVESQQRGKLKQSRRNVNVCEKQRSHQPSTSYKVYMLFYIRTSKSRPEAQSFLNVTLIVTLLRGVG